VRRLTGKQPIVVGPGIKTGLNIRGEAHEQLGSDIVADCVAAIAKYPTPAIVIDMGTATTMTLINGTTFEGCTLMPGARIALDALFAQTAQLPNVSLDSTKVGVLARNTVDAMRSGVLHGHASMVDGMIERITEEYMPVESVVATGGNAPFVLQYCGKNITYDASLLLDGLYLLYRKNAEKNQKGK
jgi:type III pantothenate kinase